MSGNFDVVDKLLGSNRLLDELRGWVLPQYNLAAPTIMAGCP
jgi:hypothetical protein